MPAFPEVLSSSLIRLRRLNDPLVQVWVLSGAAVVLGIIGQIRAWVPDSEGKNSQGASASRLLLAGAQLDWKENFGPGVRTTSRPQLQLPLPATPRLIDQTSGRLSANRPYQPAVLNFASAMEEAAGKPWQYLHAGLRQQIRQALPSAGTLQIQLHWSGDRRGNANSLLQSDHSRTPARFVIGNGTRSGDGEIEFCQSALPLTREPVEVILIGGSPHPTPGQTAALGELLHGLEAMSGRAIQTADPDETAAGELRQAH